MSRVVRCISAVLAFWILFAGPIGSADAASSSSTVSTDLREPETTATWTPDVWHYVKQGSPFYAPDPKSRHSAAVVQTDGSFAHFILGTQEQGAIVTVILPGSTPAATLISDLVMPAGNVLSRTVTAAQLATTPVPERDETIYSFRIAPDDIELFMAAAKWRVKTEDAGLTLTLKGSRKAITMALEARDARAESTSPDP